MNKKLFLGMFAAAGMLFATSCSNDELDVVQSGNEAQVTFNLGTEGGIATRAISDGKTANKLVYAVFNSAGEPLSVFDANNDGEYEHQMVETIGDITETPHTVTITLAKGQTYHVAFWAQNSACGAYGTSDLREITVSYDGFNNDENRDAFFKTEIFEVKGNETRNVTLKRPFAQINVGVTAEDWAAAKASGVNINKSSVTLENAATKINLLTGEVSAPQKVEYKLSTIPNDPEILKVDVDKDGDFEEYQWLSMCYILPADFSETVDENGVLGTNKSTLESLSFTFSPETGNDFSFDEGLAGAPVRRNWRTNILGKILTGDIQFNITIDQEFKDDYNINYPGSAVNVENREQLDNLLSNSFIGTLLFGDGFDYNTDDKNDDNAIDFSNSSNAILEGGSLTAGDENDYAANAKSGSTVTINNVNITSNGGGIGATDGSTVEFNSGSVYVDSPSTSGRYIFYAAGAGTTITINGGNFSWDPKDNLKRAYIYADAGTTVYVKGGTFGKASTRSGYTAGILGEGTVIITGGSFGFDPSAWVASDYTATENNEVWTVSAN